MPRGDWAPEHLDAWLALIETPGLGRAVARRLLRLYGDPLALVHGGRPDLDAGLTPAAREALDLLRRRDRHTLHARTWDWLQDPAHTLVPLGDPLYPAALLERHDPPLLLHAQGSLAALSRPQLAIIGSREATAQGQDTARHFAARLAAEGIVIVSGLAMGIDAQAHEGALEGAVRGQPATIAVVGTGLDRCYPARHAGLARRIAAGGLLLSEFPLGTAPHPTHFPRRNRLIAHLAAGTLVVEAALRSGSLITARQALDAGREVMAVPGSVLSPQSRGCHGLIRDGAALVETPRQVMELLGGRDGWPEVAPLPPEPAPPRRRGTRPDLPDETPLSEGDPPPPGHAAVRGLPAPADASALECRVLDALGLDPVGLDTLVVRTGLQAQELSAHLLAMELQAWVARLPGGRFQRRAPAP